MKTWQIAVISGLKAFAVAAVAQMAVMTASGQDCVRNWQVWAVAGLAAVLKGSEKAVSVKRSK